MISSTAGLLCDKARDSTAAKLKDGDITDAKIREIVVRELDDIKTKLDGLSRVNLLSSYRFLKEGVELLNVSLDKSKLEQKAVKYPTQENRHETPRMSSGVECGILNEALELSHAMGKMKINSSKELEAAKQRFKYARIRATDAFCNEALKIEDRIFAAKLRIVSEILECLESPEYAITGCLSLLRELHGLPAIRELFSVYLRRGVMSRLNKAERVANVKSVMLINNILFNFNFKFSRKLSDRVIWPETIKLTGRSFNPILDWQEVSTRKSMGELSQNLHRNLTLDQEVIPYLSAVNSHGDHVVVGEYYEVTVTIIFRTGENKVVPLPDHREGEVIEQYIEGLTVDNGNNVYVVRWFEARTKNGNVKADVLNVLDENFNVKHICKLYFFEATNNFRFVRIAVNKNNIIMVKYGDPHVYICDGSGQLKYKFERDSRRDTPFPPSLNISNNDEIMLSSDGDMAVHFYTEEGNLKSTIKLPEGHDVHGVAFHCVICKMIALTYVREKDSYFLLCYSKTGELETSTFFFNRNNELHPAITSHRSGHVAVVREKSITFI
jgi:hypothetical protein